MPLMNARSPHDGPKGEGNIPNGGEAPPGAGPFTICAITYLSRPDHLPPLYNAARSLVEDGCRIEAFGTVRKIGKKPHEVIAPGFTFSRVDLRSRTLFYRLPGRLRSNILLAGMQYLFSYLEYNARTILKARKCRPDLVEAHDLPALPCAWLISRIRRRPLVYRAHELWAEMGADVRFAGFWRMLEKLFIRGADLVVVPEPNRARIYLEEYGARELPLVVANCPPLRSSPGGAAFEDLFAGRGQRPSCVVLYQGLISTDRCIEEIVESAGQFQPGISLAMIGHGVDAWRDPPARLPEGSPIVHVPHVPYDQLAAYTASAHIGLLFYRNTCRNNFYCAPNKLYEYMMMGLPVVTCRYPGLVDFVEGQEIGLCVDPGNPGEIAGAVNRIAGDPALRERMRENCLRLAGSRWNWENEYPRLRAAYAALCPGLLAAPAPARKAAPHAV
jgi:glycosyltransferase involved in cell wall biosynthesis